MLPEGLVDGNGDTLGNATDWCCNFTDSGQDDVAYLTSLVDEARTHAPVGDILAVGHSNGGFMAYRLACVGMPGLKGIASLAGTSYSDPAPCDSAPPVSVLHFHGDDDVVVRYDGQAPTDENPGYSGAEAEVRRWATRAGCGAEDAAAPVTVDIESVIEGAETVVTRFNQGCSAPVTIDLWRIGGATHIPSFKSDIGERVVGWLLSV
ncbi:MAG: polyhydroxybutyrate depolymerase [Rhodothermales bacterium]|jgi:polyhydroxybutyrate depolymerase